MRLEDTTIVVTGGSSGLGKAMAAAFISEGANTVCMARNSDRLSNAIEEITGGTGSGVGITGDVRSWDDIQRVLNETEDTYGPIDVFVNNAGIRQIHVADDRKSRGIVDIPIDVWDAIIDTNLRGVFLCTKAVLPSMLERNTGRVIHITSGHGTKGRPKRAAYCASKFGVEGFHQTLAKELEQTGVSSLALRPPSGGVMTEIREELDTEMGSGHDPSVMGESAVRLAAGAERNGGRFVARADGEGYDPY